MNQIGIVFGFVIALILIGLIAYIIGIFNSLVTLRNNIRKAWANIDVLLKQRYDEVPNLIESVKGYMKHEKAILEEIARIRSAMMRSSSKAEIAGMSMQLSSSIKSLFAVAENYPKLQASGNFLKLQERITALENEIADRRELYNDSINIYNTKTESFPDMFIARWFKFAKETPFCAAPEEKNNVNVRQKIKESA